LLEPVRRPSLQIERIAEGLADRDAGAMGRSGGIGNIAIDKIFT
jgi:hypothetical protein